MTIHDYPAVYELWLSCKGMGLNDVDDSESGIARFLERNPTTCFVSETDGKLTGVIMAGSDGRRRVHLPYSGTSFLSTAGHWLIACGDCAGNTEATWDQ